MIKALNSKKQIVFIDESNKNENYFCQLCNQEVITKKGPQRAHHFAHKRTNGNKNAAYSFCVDTWTYSYSKWRYNWMSQFPKENVEVPLDNGKEKHLTDVIINDTVILFMAANTSFNTIVQRIMFFKSMKMNIIFVFDFISLLENNVITQNQHTYFWDRPSSLFKNIYNINKNHQVYIQISNELNKKAIYKIYSYENNFHSFCLDFKNSFSINEFINLVTSDINKLIIKNAKEGINIITQHTARSVTSNSSLNITESKKEKNIAKNEQVELFRVSDLVHDTECSALIIKSPNYSKYFYIEKIFRNNMLKIDIYHYNKLTKEKTFVGFLDTFYRNNCDKKVWMLVDKE